MECFDVGYDFERFEKDLGEAWVWRMHSTPSGRHKIRHRWTILKNVGYRINRCLWNDKPLCLGICSLKISKQTEWVPHPQARAWPKHLIRELMQCQVHPSKNIPATLTTVWLSNRTSRNSRTQQYPPQSPRTEIIGWANFLEWKPVWGKWQYASELFKEKLLVRSWLHSSYDPPFSKHFFCIPPGSPSSRSLTNTDAILASVGVFHGFAIIEDGAGGEWLADRMVEGVRFTKLYPMIRESDVDAGDGFCPVVTFEGTSITLDSGDAFVEFALCVPNP